MTTIAPRTEQSVRQDADGTAHITYFDQRTQASFSWDGISKFAQVALGGYGEPIDHHLELPKGFNLHEQYPDELLEEFARLCDRHAKTLPDYRTTGPWVRDDSDG